jgi:LCP family protein required for cell wall assembly
LAVCVLTVTFVAAIPRQRDVRYIVGTYKELATPTPAPEPDPTAVPDLSTQPPLPQPLAVPRPIIGPPGNGRIEPAHPYRAISAPPGGMHFFVVIGTDARPGQDMTRTRADSIHIAAVDPVSREGTILGIPRDSYVDIEGHGKQKINAATVYGGPNLLVKTLRELTKMPISHYAITGFEGIEKMVDTLLGLDVYVPYKMDDEYSGAHFNKGWKHMDGAEVLAFSRARHGVPGGDFGRSKNQGTVMGNALKKMRAETDGKEDIRRWLDVLYKHAELDMSIADALKFGLLAREIIPSELVNVVTPGKAQTIGGQSVVVLGDEAEGLFKDVRWDAVADGDTKRNPPKPAPTPEPTPKPTPTPGLLDPIVNPDRTPRPTPR